MNCFCHMIKYFCRVILMLSRMSEICRILIKEKKPFQKPHIILSLLVLYYLTVKKVLFLIQDCRLHKIVLSFLKIRLSKRKLTKVAY